MNGLSRYFAVAAVLVLAACAGDTGDPGGGTATPGLGETGGQCAGIIGTPCGSEADYCHLEPGACIEIADAAGVCRPKPEVCTMDYRPVCGCDGVTYSNACAAAAAGTSVALEGPCAPGE